MKRIDEKGFSLFESMIHLLIFTILIQLTLLFFHWKEPVQSSYQNDFLSEWEVFSLEVQELLKEVHVIEQPRTTSFTFHTERGRITLQVYQQMIRKLVNGEGHVPLLVDLRSANFLVEGNRLKIMVEKTNGIKKEGTFAIGISSQ
ncbi:competence type IV pilus minor pilin ComGF [Sporosarcina sp. GW1-11]|uniref:competence type IV pilus minor pilin ComGF n=1 Tax=Sporosarcina sp. GW1-11 TaxID=2899126 RepID=UPI00294E6A33|nr:competence type IV pilus minor pilin ComGF [Sporosarcina sp. GW1-11]MDV6377893.1 competence type IV pilus minor pilin ComGF [Sporosarcina sp. GW1-11]